MSAIQLPLIFLIFLHLSAALPCRPGTFATKADAACKPCPRGSYQGLTILTPTRCKKCPPGTYLPFRRGAGKDVCLRCPHNTFSTAKGAISSSTCKPCPPGMVSVPGSVKCFEPCNKCQVLRRDGCQGCQFHHGNVGGRCEYLGDTRNFSCDEGKLISCKAGFTPYYSRCKPCGKTSIIENGECRRCPLGLVPDANRTACIPCPKGMGIGKLCKECPPGQNTKVSRPRCVPDGTPCPSNFFEDSSGSCRTCARGEQFDRATRKCVKCAENESSPGGISTRCKKCGRNQVGGAGCKCRPGFNRDARLRCVPCPAGTFDSRHGCEDCPIGFFSEPGSTFCQICPPGSAAPEIRSGSCTECTDGLVASVLTENEYPSQARIFLPVIAGLFDPMSISRSDCVDPKTNCPPHLNRVSDALGNFFCEPRSCPPDTQMAFIQPRSTFTGKVRTCVSCNTGSFLASNGRCKRCTKYEVSKGGTTRKCRPCPGSERRVLGKCFCGSRSGAQSQAQFRDANGDCQRCPAGTSSFGSEKEIFRCPRCPRGRVTTRPGVESCSLCRPGTVERNRTTCEKCPRGYTSYGLGDTECVKIGGGV